jgi:hypothetical protein
MAIYSYALISDRMDQIRFGARAAAVLAGVELRGGAAPGMAKLGLPGVKKGNIWVGRGLRDTRSPPGAFAGLREAGCGARCVGGGPARRCFAGALALGDSRTGIRVCGFCVCAQSQSRPGQGTVRARRRCRAPATAELRRRGIGERCLGTGVGQGLRQLMQ